ncbi:MAG: T9SS type A sorting domain-containing protein [Putridiphycobacter sp.]|nr:T9SS type A sorting domain-containing protein [Putridiphycobacter sp.]
MKRILPIVLLLLPIQIFAQLNSATISVGNETREYVAYIPSNYQNTEAAPLIIILHGIGGLATDYATYGLNPIADTARFVPVYLQGKANAFGQTSWNNGTLLASAANDLAFIENMIDTMAVNYNIDRSRVYIVGISMGAIMTYKALHHLSDKLAAAVCHIGTMSNQELTNYNPTIPRPVMQIHGVNDAIVPYSGQALPSLGLVPPTLAKLKSTNGWNGDSTITNIPNVANDSVTIEKIVYNTSTRLEHWKMSGAGAGHIFLFEPINDTSGMEITWHFLREFSHPNPTLGINTSSIAEQPLIFPNPTSDFVNIANYKNYVQIRLYNLNQQLVFETASATTVDLSRLEAGMYIIELKSTEGQPHTQLLHKQ